MGMAAEAGPSGTLVAETRHSITWLPWNLSFGFLSHLFLQLQIHGTYRDTLFNNDSGIPSDCYQKGLR